ncbi:hypothetical protein L1987_63345 [Smallanthus sonchifolius]|uniref:Uncharacterized protein n=1 Tax=Smallanthus sonchifolius TaxID=185202 RepID=A0ACB9CDC1_9ASTR|nr:hypothetical protein L1987_63345 [Smallanthus sonchifolius]
MSPLTILLLPFFFIIAISAQYKNSTYPNCPSYDCGNVTIRYPFWNTDSGSTTQFCGYEGINCSDNGKQNIPKISFGGDSYYVQSIDYELEIVFLVDYDVSPVSTVRDSCPRVRHSINLGTLPFNFSVFSVNLSFHFDCNGCPSFAMEITCLEQNDRKVCLDVMNNGTDESVWDAYLCDQEVVTTVIGEKMRLVPNLATGFGRVLEEGFELRSWGVDDCDGCEASDGRCGYRDSTGFVCFCMDGTTSKGDCKD